ncbi:uncharacterized protein LOC135143218 [Zophobas morio]|uniref:uncharacterized protein LOC135143218 n=1 Tax=Zophobas morio TaxID=2755281 RepID=UPI003082796E
MLDDIKTLIAKRAALKTRLTKFNNFIADPRNGKKAINLKRRLASIEPCLREYQDIEVQISTVDEIQVKDDEATEFENKYFEAVSNAESLIQAAGALESVPNSNSPSNRNETLPVKLPEICLPTFDGSFTEWLSFRDSFQSLINNNTSLNAIQKFHYLKGTLSGEAQKTISHLTPSTDNYAAAWALLVERYENNRLISQHHVRSLFSLPNINPKDSASLRTLLQIVNSNLKALEGIGRPVHQWDDLLIHLISCKFDHGTTIAWEGTLSKDIPTTTSILEFLTQRCQMFESFEATFLSNKFNVPNKPKFPFNAKYNKPSSHIVNRNEHSQISCNYCKQSHTIFFCQSFLGLNVDRRLNEIKKRHLCTNCLRSGHTLETCNAGNCKKCNRRHNTLLHIESQPQPSSSTMSNCAQILSKNVILSTTQILATGANNKGIKFRSLLDNGSVSNFITERAVQKLGLKNIHKINLPLIGIACKSSIISKAVSVKISSISNSFKAYLDFLIVPEITGNVPAQSFTPLQNLPTNIKLADPFYNKSLAVDLLIGNEIFWDILCIGQFRINKNGPTLQKTQFGWVIGGVLNQFNSSNNLTSCNLSNISLDKQIRKFWEVENLPEKSDSSSVNNTCEVHFKETFTRDATSGRFIVKPPLINEPPCLGISKERALRLFYNLEKRFSKDRNLFQQYSEFMRVCLALGHMTECEPDNSGYFLSHHPVHNESSTTTKLRVVFNASMKTDNNKSINDNLLVGPNLQQDLFSILIRFRIHKVVVCADLKKMYRQILLHPDHRKYQKIFWRNDSGEDIKVYQLNTVTYGFASSSYLATRCVHELANLEMQNFPEAATIILRDMYVDDLIYGSSNIVDAAQLLNDIKQILIKAGFELHKISSNYSCDFGFDEELQQQEQISLDKQNTIKTLGLFWDNNNDIIKYSTHSKNPRIDKITKRGILSTIAHIFDPLGLAAPVVITAKIILQKLWSLKLDWDESLPIELHTMWCEFLETFSQLNQVAVPRRAICDYQQVEIHGFCDASPDGTYQTHILCSKNKVAPLQSLTIPRLELCGALLLAKLVYKVTKSLSNFQIRNHYYWTDSTIVLAWLRTEPALLKSFASHRVSEIQSLAPYNNWYHIPSNQNPADILSRGDTPRHLMSSDLWWHGPSFLTTPHIPYIQEVPSGTNLPEMKPKCCLIVQRVTKHCSLWSKFSNFDKLLRITALVRRFIFNLKNKHNKKLGAVTCSELREAHSLIITQVQSEAFHIDIHNIKKHNQVANNSKIKNLSPFIDSSGLVRVGGRLAYSNIHNDRKYPLLLPKQHFITNLIIKKYHVENLHIGCQGTLAAVRQRYWPVSAKNAVKLVIFNCLRCYRCKPISYEQLMADLPVTRVTPSRPFTVTGVDYAGPFTLKNGHGRTVKTIKGYIAVFVCFATKAVHIELVCDCTSNSFLNALKRFISRRGKPSQIHSDNGTTFVGSNRHLKELYQLFQTKSFKDVVVGNLSNLGITWNFIPPNAPHMGGLWEAAVKSIKGHIRRVLNNTLLNYEEMNTVLIMIEACLNSRPLTPLSNDPNDLVALTPAHFLIGGPLTAPVEEDLRDLPTNRLIRFQLLEKMRQDVWKRWSNEYLHQLQTRYKWRNVPALKPAKGDLVVVREASTPPQQWPLGRIEELHPGKDGQCRVVTIKTMRGVFKRPLTKICVLPMDSNKDCCE